MPHIEYKGSGGGGPAPARIRVESEHEAEHGWVFEIAVRAIGGEGAPSSLHTVSLSYRDHDMWSGGRMSPSHLIEQVVAYAMRHRAEELPAKFDAARVRYWFPQFDQEMRSGSVG